MVEYKLKSNSFIQLKSSVFILAVTLNNRPFWGEMINNNCTKTIFKLHALQRIPELLSMAQAKVLAFSYMNLS